MPRHILTIDDLTLDEIDAVAARATSLIAGDLPARDSFSAGLLFLSSSLRTRVGFSVAVIRLGGSPIHVSELRFGPTMSASESLPDALRTLSGMVDVVIARAPVPFTPVLIADNSIGPFINGGDASDHPSQALIDLTAIGLEKGDIAHLHLAMCGDLTMRAAQSLLKLFNRRLPRRLTLIAPPSRSDASVIANPELLKRTDRRPSMDLGGVDIVYMIGLPQTAGDDVLSTRAREEFILTGERLATAPLDAVVLAPLPVVDEIAPDVRLDSRVRMFEQSDHGVSARMALIELAMGRLGT